MYDSGTPRKPYDETDFWIHAPNAVSSSSTWISVYGVRTVVGPCPMDLGRDVELYAAVAQTARINIVCATGMYVEAMGITYAFAPHEQR